MAVIAIMAALAAVSAGIYSGYVERAREAELYETAEQTKMPWPYVRPVWRSRRLGRVGVLERGIFGAAQSSGQRPVSLCGSNDRGLYRLFPEDKAEWGRAVFYCWFYVFHGRI